VTPQPDQAEIALREKRKQEQEQKKLRAEQLAQEKAARLAQQQHQEELQQQRLAAQKAAAAEKLAEQKAAEKAAEKAARLEAAKEKAARVAAQRREEQQLAKLQQQSRQDYLKSLMSQAGNGASPAGTAATSAGPSGGYAARLATLIRENVIYPQVDQIQGNPKVTLSVMLDPNSGEVLGVSVKHSSGVPSWDAAVVRAVKRLGKLPSDHGRWWTPMEVVAGPRDQAN
jgi:colicin import membrane protein